MCEHSPLSIDDCKPYKPLRTTIRVFLRTEEKKRESSRPKDAAPATPVDPSPVSATPTMSLEQQKPSVEEVSAQVEEQPQDSAEPAAENAMDGQERAEGMHDQEAQDERPVDDVGLFSSGFFFSPPRLSMFSNIFQEQAPHDGAEEPEASSTALVPAEKAGDEAEGGEGDEAQNEGNENDDEDQNAEGPSEGQFGPMNGFFPAGFDQMQMMMAMQNGFNFPMMGECPEQLQDSWLITNTFKACQA